MISIREKAILVRNKNDFDSSQRMTYKDLRNVMLLFYLKGFYVTSKATALLQKCWNKVPLQMLNLQKVRKLDLRMCAFNPVQPLNLNFKKLFKN